MAALSSFVLRDLRVEFWSRPQISEIPLSMTHVCQCTRFSPPSLVNSRCVSLAKKSKESKHERSHGLKAASEASCVVYSVEGKAPK